MIARNPHRRLCMTAGAVLAALATVHTPSAYAQQPAGDEQPAARSSEDQKPGTQDRAYRSKRERALSERARFAPQVLPAGPSIARVIHDAAADDGYDRGYEDGFEEGFRAAQRTAADDRRASLYDAAVLQGIEHFQHLRYGAAARSFILAARNDQGDPRSRLHAAHAMVALQHYDDAFLMIRRAFQLQPDLIYLPLDIREAYTDPAEFQKHVDQLATRAKADEHNPRLWTLLGYYHFFSDEHQAAFRALRRAGQLPTHDKLAAVLLNAARISTPASDRDHANLSTTP